MVLSLRLLRYTRISDPKDCKPLKSGIYVLDLRVRVKSPGKGTYFSLKLYDTPEFKYFGV